ncbi:cupin domain-containing protein [Paenibacillus harenae]|uniref:cupin domain-containing protein n=1 Tax=Paenibacillus harenae TaxID=306543 RepID=UPI00040D52EE|nr:cupin domain-containing protein [Paenibacillus harenae]
MGAIGEWENAEPGVKRKILQPGKSLMMMEVHFIAGAEGYEHSHPHEQLSYCLEGELEFRLDGKPVTVKAGESIVIPSGVKHGVTAKADSVLLDAFTPLREDLLRK